MLIVCLYHSKFYKEQCPKTQHCNYVLWRVCAIHFIGLPLFGFSWFTTACLHHYHSSVILPLLHICSFFIYAAVQLHLVKMQMFLLAALVLVQQFSIAWRTFEESLVDNSKMLPYYTRCHFKGRRKTSWATGRAFLVAADRSLEFPVHWVMHIRIGYTSCLSCWK